MRAYLLVDARALRDPRQHGGGRSGKTCGRRAPQLIGHRLAPLVCGERHPTQHCRHTPGVCSSHPTASGKTMEGIEETQQDLAHRQHHAVKEVSGPCAFDAKEPVHAHDMTPHWTCAAEPPPTQNSGSRVSQLRGVRRRHRGDCQTLRPGLPGLQARATHPLQGARCPEGRQHSIPAQRYAGHGPAHGIRG
jgi:hypothetical protein